VVLLHGMGEHAGRYGDVAQVFASHGVEFCGVDIPGFGRSKGQRGHMEGLWVPLVVISEAVEYLRGRLPAGARLGIAGHSFGGFLALAYLGRFREVFDFAWLSSPLIEPGRHTGSIMRRIALAVEPLLPRFVLKHGIRPERCTRDPKRAEEVRADPLIHGWVSLRIGRMLLDEAPNLLRRPLNPRLRMLVTQGGADGVCPPEFMKRFFDAANLEDKTLREFEGLLHEPFRDVGGERVLEALGQWLDRILS
jgi:alpha-beta hydrolase superfamily lysophospholipase